MTNEEILNIAVVLLPLVIGFILDLILGDPYSWPHPIKVFGNLIGFMEKRLNKDSNKKLKGAFAALFLILSTFCFFYFVKNLVSLQIYADIIVSSIFIFYGLANRSLINEVMKVNRALTDNGLEAGRKQLSFIVGRNTSKLGAQSIRRASLETLAENLSDGVIAPLFYLFIGGFPLMLTYKMINTLDSMIGYKSERYKNFGFFAAKTDDVFNYIPARITAFLMTMVSLSPRSFRFIKRYGKKHSSPNAGYPEAALAGALNCRFGGNSEYHGQIVEKPFIGDNQRELNQKDVNDACRINLLASTLFLVLGLSILFLIL